jgi:1-acyl-sn-glycerol-3-phosphate acyltransferase
LDYTYKTRTLFQSFCLWVMTSLGWKLHDDLPDLPKYVVIGAPHTSNWDFVLGLFGMKAIGLPLRWIGKHTIFRWPYGWFFRHVLGGIAVDRRGRHDFVAQIVDLYNRSDRLSLVMTPEGTRGRTRYWKTGFYWIALGANIPIVLGFMDWDRQEAGVGPILWPSGDIDADFEVIKDFYADKMGRHRARKSTLALRARYGGTPSRER